MKRFASTSFGEPAHVGRVYLGLAVGKDGRVPPLTRDAVIQAVSQAAGGASTTYHAKGQWVTRDASGRPVGPLIGEDSIMIEVVTSARESCSQFKRQLRSVASAAAKFASQQAILVVTTCASGETDATLVAPGDETLPL